MNSSSHRWNLGILSSHPIQYQAPWFRMLAKEVDLTVYFAFKPDAKQQGDGFNQSFEWDLDLLSGYSSRFLENLSPSPSSSDYGGCDTPSISSAIEKQCFDAFIVCGWHLKCYWQAVKACRRFGIPALVRGDSQLLTPRSRVKAFIKRVFYPQMLGKFDGFLSVGVRNREYLYYYGVSNEKIFSAPHFVDNGWFRKTLAESDDKSVEIRRGWGAGSETLVVGFVGKFVPKKRPSDMVAAIAQIPDRKKIQAVYVGSGELEVKLRAEGAVLIRKPIFEGFKNQTELPAIYSAADVLVLPSDGGETWGLVVNEAMACGTPAIVSDACGCAPDLIDEGKTGYTFPCGNVNMLADRIQQVYAKKEDNFDWKPSLREKLAQYSVDACVEGTLNAVTAITERKGKAIK